MSLSPDKVRHLAKLSQIAISLEDAANFSNQLTRILTFVDQLESYDTHDVLPMEHPLPMTQRLRLDEITLDNRRDEFLKSAPAVEDGLYLVPQVIE